LSLHSAAEGQKSGMIMADRSGLKLVGFIFATVTLAVMLVTGVVVTSYASGAYSLESPQAEDAAVSIR
jgi:hypothetical protein